MASTEVGSIHYDLDLDDKNFKRKVQDVKGELKGLDGAFRDAEKGSKAFLGGVLALGAAAGGLIAKTTLTAARTETLGIAMNAIAKATGTSTDELAKQEKILKEQGIATQEARQILSLFMQSQLDVAEASKVARVAQDLAVISGENSSQTANILTQAIVTQSAELLRQFGITKTSVQIFEEYGATIGKSGDELTNAEKKQSFLNLIMTEGEKVAGTYEAAMETAGKKLGSLDRYFQEAANTIGAVFLPAFGELIDALTEFLKQVTPENIEKVFKTIVDWGPIVAGVIIGAIVPALYAMAAAWVAALLPLLPFIAIGAALGAWFVFFRDSLTQARDTIENIWIPAMQKAKDFIIFMFDVLKSKVEIVVNVIGTFLRGLAVPFTWLYQNVIEPILLLIQAIFFKVFYEIFNFVSGILSKLFNFIKNIFLEPIKNIIMNVFNTISNFVGNVWNAIKSRIEGPINSARSVVDGVVNSIWGKITGTFNGIVNFLGGLWGRIVNGIVGPFEEAKRKIEEIGQKIRDAANNINPFYRQSPSLVDNVMKGIKLIKKEYESLADIRLPDVNMGGGFGDKGGDFGRPALAKQDINVYVDKMGDRMDLEAVGRELGFKAGLMPEL
jgi:phage-related protein